MVGGDQERAALLEPARDLVGAARTGLERGLALLDAVVVDRGDGLGVVRLGGANVDRGHLSGASGS